MQAGAAVATPARGLRVAYCVGVGVEFALLGPFYSFPLWVTDFKSLYALDEVVVNLVASLLYLASMLSFALVVAVKALARRHLSVLRRQLLLYALSPTCAMAGYVVLWLTTAVYRGETHKATAAVLLCVGAFLISLATGFAFGVLTSDLLSIVFVGWDDTLAGVTNVAYVLGGVLVCFMYWGLDFGAPDLPGLFFGLFLANAVAFLIALAMAQLATHLETVQPIPERLRDDALRRKMAYVRLAEDAAGGPAAPRRSCACLPRAVHQHLTSPWGWAVQFSFGLKIGIGASFSAALGVWATSLGATSNQVALLVTVFVALQLTGRVLYTVSSLYVESVRHQRGVVTPSRFVLVAIMVIALFYVAATLLAAFQPTSLNEMWYVLVLFSVGYGGMWSSSTTLIKQGCVNGPGDWLWLGSIVQPMGGIFAVAMNLVIGALYDVNADAHHRCMGPQCFRYGFIFLAACSTVLLCLCFALFLHHRAEDRRLAHVISSSDVEGGE